MTNFVFKYRWIIILTCLAVGVLSVTQIPGIKVDPEIRNYITLSMKSRIATDSIEKVFGVQDMVVILFSGGNIITKDNLLKIKDIDRAISRINGVSNRMSLFTVRSIRSQEGAMIVDPLIRGIPEDTAQLKQLGKEILSNEFARDNVISSDLTTASITATIDNNVPESRTLAGIDSIVNAHPGNFKVYKGGLPYIRQSLMKDVRSDAVVLVPAALLIMLLVLKFNLGKWKSVMMPFSVVLLSMVFTLGLIPVLGWKMSIITVLVPVILIAVANNYGIYLTARFHELRILHPEASDHEIIRLLLRSLNMPILFSGLTTIAGILGLLTHSIIPARQVGILAASGVSLALLMSLLLIPALIFVSHDRGTKVKSNINKTNSFSRLLNRLSGIIVRYPGRILLISGIAVVTISLGISFLRINTNQEAYFSMKRPVRQASELINTKFGGSQTISVMVEGDIKNPEIMKGIDRLTSAVKEEKGVGNVFSISQVVKEMSKAIFTVNEDGYDRIPESREAIAQMFELYNMSGDPGDFKQLMNPEYSKAHILIKLSAPENNVINQVKTVISGLAKQIPAKVTVGGYALIMADFARSIIRGQIYSLIFAAVTVLILLTIIFKSLKGGLIGSIPLIASVFILFGFMGFAGIALDAATALLSSIMIGVGVDFTIQYIWCFNIQIRMGSGYASATYAALKTIGRSIIINALGVMAGFSALIFSGFLSIRFFGYLVIISIGSCLIGAIVVIPAILVKFKPGFIGFVTINNKSLENEGKNDVTGISYAANADVRTTSGRIGNNG